MRIGLTFDLQEEHSTETGVPADAFSEFDTEESIAYLEEALASLGYEVQRIGNVHKLVAFLAQDDDVDIIFNMAEGMHGRSRESQVPCLLEAHRIPYVGSDPLTLALCLDKAMAKTVWRAAGLPTPGFAVISQPEALHGTDNGLPPLPLFVKPLHEGTSKGIGPESVVQTRAALEQRVAWIARTYKQPALVEAFLPGREYSVGILGNRAQAYVIGVTEIRERSRYGVVGYAEKQRWGHDLEGVFRPVERGPLWTQLATLALRAYTLAGCRDLGRVDLRCDAEGAPQILEINPIVGLHPTGSVMPIIATQAGMSFETLIGRIVTHAIERYEEVGSHVF
ncbi:MAG: D-alanine--D-alanine ligase family protein [Anaerolineae bacterium]